MDEHECLKKQCKFLEKFKSHPYWAYRSKIMNERKNKKDKMKEVSAVEEKILKRFQALTANLEGFAAVKAELKGDVCAIRCATTQKVKLAAPLRIIQREFGFDVEIKFIENSYYVRNALIEKVKKEQNFRVN